MNNASVKKLQKISVVVVIMIAFTIPMHVVATPSFIGNIIGSYTPSNFDQYWNQVTSENAAKWGSVESTRDSMNWSSVQSHYDYAKQRGYPFKYHCFVWGQQQPSWMNSISGSEQRAEVQEYIQAAAQKFSNCDMWDVVNEPLHAKPDYRSGLGGDGSTGWDWVITVFEMANQYCTSGILLINEYGIVNDSSATSNYITIINLLKSRGLIDGIGVQSHCFNIDSTSASTIQSNLDTLTNTGLPIYSSEFDSQGDDNTQLNNYKQKFPVFYNHSNVKGITLWGYIQGETWRDNTGLVSSGSVGASERPAMQWLKQYLTGGTPGPTDPPTPTPTPEGTVGPTAPPGTGNGLKGDYYSDMNLGTLALTRTDATINFDWVQDSPDTSIPNDNFSIRWTGEIEPVYTDTYTFYENSDDGCRLTINNQLIIDKWISEAATEYTGTIDLVAGQKVPIQIEFYEEGGEASIKLSWSSNNQSKEIVPQSRFYSETGPDNLGDVDGDGEINIVDALLIAQYYVGLVTIDTTNADTNCDGSIDIVDALLIAQYYVGLINQFC
ncbi:MAG: endo-1,4-beta-xylanase [Spirochaetales bacterium]|nr:endo-1,4-beta-xylanase [Spirochaetales bacterium]